MLSSKSADLISDVYTARYSDHVVSRAVSHRIPLLAAHKIIAFHRVPDQQ